MIKYLSVGVGGSLWFALVFFIGWRMTFPSDEVANYVSYHVAQATNDTYKLQMNSISPWGVGAIARGISVFSSDPRRPDEGDSLFLEMSELRVASTLGSVIARAPVIKGTARFGEIPVNFKSETELVDGLFKLNSVEVDSTGLPFSTLGDLLSGSVGIALTSTGGLDTMIRMDLSKGLREANGVVKFKSRDLVITEIELPMMGPLGQQIVFDELNIELDIDDGKAKFDKGRLKSDVVSIDLEGELILREPFERSTLRLDAVLELGEAFSMVQGFIASAKWDDERYHYSVTGTVMSPTFRPARQPSSRSSTVTAPRRTVSTPSFPENTVNRTVDRETDPGRDGPADEDGDELEDRRARRDEMRRRLSLGRPMSAASRPEEDEDFEAGEDFDGEDDFELEEGEEGFD